MKKLLFIGIVALMVQSLGAVTLPGTSYSPYAGGSTSTSTEQTLLSGGAMVTGSYSMLGDAPRTVCQGEESGFPPEEYATCKDCCDDQGYDKTPEGRQAYADCIAGCMAGPSLPLDGGLSILLLLSVAGGAVKLLRNRNKE
ncbi:MAG: hypothetical protein MJ003_06620 [Paludibacteraceae bacterium]|nr:hypothetical protein [Paludibacteraceae bacterium]